MKRLIKRMFQVFCWNKLREGLVTLKTVFIPFPFEFLFKKQNVSARGEKKKEMEHGRCEVVIFPKLLLIRRKKNYNVYLRMRW